METVTITEAAKRTPFSEPTLRGMVQRRELDAIKVGRRVFIPVEELQRKLGILYRAH
jgi:excisionase family DNA binding protein